MTRVTLAATIAVCALQGTPDAAFGTVESRTSAAWTTLEVAYRQPNGWDASLTRMDLHFREGDASEPQPLMVFIHGGGWTGGDKSNIAMRPNLLEFFLDRGYTVAVPNYRLPFNALSPGATWEDQVGDIAMAFSWLGENAASHGATTDSTVVVGYSSGAHMAALIATDTARLGAVGFDIGRIAAVITLDVHAYDIPLALQLMADSPLAPRIPFIEALFGADLSSQNDASPTHHLGVASADSGWERVGPFLVASVELQPGVGSQEVSPLASQAFVDALNAVGKPAQHTYFAGLSHSQIVMEFGAAGDPVRPIVEAFLDRVERARGGVRRAGGRTG